VPDKNWALVPDKNCTKKIEILPTILYNVSMEEVKYLLADFIDRFNVVKPPAKNQVIKEGK
jgi:hypothetical protein